MSTQPVHASALKQLYIQKGDEKFVLADNEINDVKTSWVKTVLPATLPSPVHVAALQHQVGPVTGPWKWGRKKAVVGFVLMVMLASLPGLLCKGDPTVQHLGMGPSEAAPSSCFFFPL